MGAMQPYVSIARVVNDGLLVTIIIMDGQTYPEKFNGMPIPYDAVFDELCENISTPGPLAWVSCIALSHMETQAALEKLIELSQAPDWRYRRMAIEALAYHPQVANVTSVLATALQDPSPYVVRTACQVIRKVKLVSLHDNVLPLMNSKQSATRQEAIKTVDAIWHNSDFDTVFSCFLTDVDGAVRKQAAWVLITHTSEDNWQKLFGAWWQDEVIRHRQWACELAYRYQASRFEKELKILQADPDGHVRKAATKALQSFQS